MEITKLLLREAWNNLIQEELAAHGVSDPLRLEWESKHLMDIIELTMSIPHADTLRKEQA